MRLNLKKRCAICGHKHITAANKDGLVCTYCKTSRRREAREYLENVTMKIGTKVKMINCAEANHPKYKDRIWKTRSNPWRLCGSMVVLLEGFSGGFSIECLEVVE